MESTTARRVGYAAGSGRVLRDASRPTWTMALFFIHHQTATQVASAPTPARAPPTATSTEPESLPESGGGGDGSGGDGSGGDGGGGGGNGGRGGEYGGGGETGGSGGDAVMTHVEAVVTVGDATVAPR